MKQKIKQHMGFTLIEVLIVILVLAILAAISIPRYSGFTERTREATDETTAAAIAKVVIAYSESSKLSTVPDYDSLPANLVDLNFKFSSLKYGGASRNQHPVLSGTVDSVIVSGNGNQAYPKATDETTAAAISSAITAYIASNKLSTVPDYYSLPANLVDLSFKFNSLKYGGASRNQPPVLSGTVDSVIVSGNGNQAYPK